MRTWLQDELKLREKQSTDLERERERTRILRDKLNLADSKVEPDIARFLVIDLERDGMIARRCGKWRKICSLALKIFSAKYAWRG